MNAKALFMAGAFLLCGLTTALAWPSTTKSENLIKSHLPLLPPPVDVTERQKWFLDYIQEIAESPYLNKADKVAKLLQSNFTTKHSESHDEAGCEGPSSQTANSRFSELDIYNPDKDFWFKSMPGGVQHMHLAGGGIFNSKPQDLGDPYANFYISKNTTCGGRTRNNPEITVNINFDNLPGFVCITQDQLRAILPQARRDSVTDGGVQYSYRTRIIEESGVLVSFSYPAFSVGNECLLGLEIEQDERYGKKAERVD